MISLADFVSHPAKVAWPTAFFLRKKTFFLYDFCVSHWPVGLWVGIWIAVLKLNIYIYMSIKTSIINTKIRISNFTQILKLPHVGVEAFTIYKSKAK